MSGYELLEWVRTSRPSDVPSIGGLLGMDIVRVEEGSVTVTLSTRADFANPLGTVHGGIAATMLDSAMSCAVHSTLPSGVGYTTLELKINYIRSASTDGQRLTAQGHVVHTGRSTATAEGRVVDENDRLIAHATTTCLILRPSAT
ncbi:PaaI family thioesterase [Tsukamurella paurometabola]|uniref:Acyl-coenzyme A thioesterase PaaI n=1 Tax=Tsukamurella paurometabola TaxID=2061 RepID=A0A3P8KDX0_TSUPA|nr:PaaI family thioesterase [Tsukamurella paurometabola]UEA85569.1 PaaI family thioesterase [Tsukamurella paurometabola]VDR37888.1 Acyl-coenzyme A thioesterase PaaI [Tsukamurella paurometabola]